MCRSNGPRRFKRKADQQNPATVYHGSNSLLLAVLVLLKSNSGQLDVQSRSCVLASFRSEILKGVLEQNIVDPQNDLSTPELTIETRQGNTSVNPYCSLLQSTIEAQARMITGIGTGGGAR
jgi:hypothetical protein